MKTTRAHAQDLAAFAFNTAAKDLGFCRPEAASPWLDKVTDEFATQVADIQADARRAALEEAIAAASEPSEQRSPFLARMAAVNRIRALLDDAGITVTPSATPGNLPDVTFAADISMLTAKKRSDDE